MPKPLLIYQPPATYQEAVARAAELWGIEDGYHDIWGRRHSTSLEAQKAILKSLGVRVDTLEQVREAVERRLMEEWQPLIPPVWCKRWELKRPACQCKSLSSGFGRGYGSPIAGRTHLARSGNIRLNNWKL